MSRRLVIASFATDTDILSASQAVRAAGLDIVDAYTPYPVHGLDRTLALKPSRLSWVCLAAGAAGAVLKLWFELWTAVVDWPLNVGGKPHNSLPAFVPITFEVMVLFAGLSTVAAFILVSRLRPGKEPGLAIAGVTDDRFALVVERKTAAMSDVRLHALLHAHGAVDVEERMDPAGAAL